MKREKLEFLWAWLDALRRRDTAAMAAALDPKVVWRGLHPGLVCRGPDPVIATFVDAAGMEIDSLELLPGERHVVLAVRSPDLVEIDGIELGGEVYNVFSIEHERITAIDDYLQRDEALAAAGLA